MLTADAVLDGRARQRCLREGAATEDVRSARVDVRLGAIAVDVKAAARVVGRLVVRDVVPQLEHGVRDGTVIHDGDNGVAQCTQATLNGAPRFKDGISAGYVFDAKPTTINP